MWANYSIENMLLIILFLFSSVGLSSLVCIVCNMISLEIYPVQAHFFILVLLLWLFLHMSFFIHVTCFFYSLYFCNLFKHMNLFSHSWALGRRKHSVQRNHKQEAASIDMNARIRKPDPYKQIVNYKVLRNQWSNCIQHYI